MKTILGVAEGNLKLLGRMLADVEPEAMCRQLTGVTNHAAWQVGHLTFARGGLAGMLGADAGVPESWQALFRPGSEPTDDLSRYPSKAELLETFARADRTCKAAVAAASDDVLERPNPIPSLQAIFPTTRLLCAGLLTSHDSLHLGQLSVWRRAMGLPRVI